MSNQANPPDRWWEGAVLYQVYPRSFADSNGDGIGDLAGIEAHLDHLRGGPHALGVDGVWLSPIFPSPLADFGYDVSNYTDVAAEFGSLDDLQRLTDACHARGLRLLLDLVPCHTSNRHPWFVESRSSRRSAKRDWYIWADPGPDGGAPTNWTAAFGGSSWEWDAPSGQFYLHTFYPEQPNLNWRNPQVAEAMHAAMRFWFERGIDGFRVDAIQAAIVDEQLRDNPPYRRASSVPGLALGTGQDPLWNVDRPEVHDVVRGMRRVADAYPGRILVGEVYAPVERMAHYFGRGGNDEFHLAFDFELLLSPWTHRDVTLAIERSEALHPVGAWPTYALSNHDNPRHATRFGRDRARLAAFILLTLRGVPVLYAGEEIGMVDAAALPGPPHDRAGRDAQRTPMQWDASPSGGFSSGTPWLPLVDPPEGNVADQQGDAGSLLSLYRRLIAARREHATLRRGSHRSLFDTGRHVLAWTRELDRSRVLVLANLARRPERVDLRRLRDAPLHAEVIVSTDRREGSVELGDLVLGGLEGVVLRL